MKIARAHTLIPVLVLLLAACGQSGSLYLPEPPQKEKEKPAAPVITPVISPEAR